MKGLLLGVALGVAGCAHGSAGPARAHAPLYLASVEGMSDDQNVTLEGSVCQGLSEGNGADVTCPESIRAALSLVRQRALLTGEQPGNDVGPAAEAEKIDQVVRCKVEVANGGFAGHLTLTSKSAGKELAHRDFQAKSFDELLVQAEPESKALVQ